MFRFAKSPLPLAALLLCAAGCGGSSSGGRSSTPEIKIDWAAVARDVSAPKSADGAIIRLIAPTTPPGTSRLVVKRPNGPAASTQTYSMPDRLPAGEYTLAIDFVAPVDGFQVSLAGFSLPVVWSPKGGLKRTDGQPLGTIVPTGRVQSVLVLPDQTFDLDQTTDLSVVAVTPFGSTAIRPGALEIRVTQGNSVRVNADGSLTGIGEGDSTVVATVDGVPSPPTVVHGHGTTLATRAFANPNGGGVFDARRNLLWIPVAAPYPAGHVEAIDVATLATVRSFPTPSQATALALSDDGSTLLVGQRSGEVVHMDPETGALGRSFTLPGLSNERVFATGLAFQPGTVDVFAAATQNVDVQVEYGVGIYDEGARRLHYLDFDQGGFLVWASPTRLYALNQVLSPKSLYAVAVDSQGATVAHALRDRLSPYTSAFTLADDRIYTSDGGVYDAADLSPLGAFDPAPVNDGYTSAYGPLIANGRAFFVYHEPGGAVLSVYRTSDFKLETTRRVPSLNGLGSVSGYAGARLIRWGDHGLAMLAFGTSYVIDNVPGL